MPRVIPAAALHIRTPRGCDDSRFLKVKHLKRLFIPCSVKQSSASYYEPLNAVRTAFDFTCREAGVIIPGIRFFIKRDVIIALVVTVLIANFAGR